MRNIRTLTSLCAAVSTALVCLSAHASDEMFAKKAAAGGMAEVAAGDTAQKMGANDAIKKYGQQMTVDHTKANDELKSLASAKKIELPTAPDPAHQKALKNLQARSGDSFDKAFKAQMVSDHKATIALFEKEASSGSDPDLKAFAAKTLPDLQQHLKMAEALP